jgi:tRNA threonylcarbamoyladenosine modification (KEOPS) complex  Pcc1 subunit
VRRPALAVALALSLLLAGCTSSDSPRAALQNKMNAVVEAANAKDSAALRSAVSDFLQEVQVQSANADITATKAEALKRVATRLLQNASALDPSPSPEPSPSASPSPSPSPSPAPSPSPSPSPTEAPPPPSPSPIIVVSASPAGGVLSPAAVPVQ